MYNNPENLLVAYHWTGRFFKPWDLPWQSDHSLYRSYINLTVHHHLPRILFCNRLRSLGNWNACSFKPLDTPYPLSLSLTPYPSQLTPYSLSLSLHPLFFILFPIPYPSQLTPYSLLLSPHSLSFTLIPHPLPPTTYLLFLLSSLIPYPLSLSPLFTTYPLFLISLHSSLILYSYAHPLHPPTYPLFIIPPRLIPYPVPLSLTLTPHS